MSRVTERANINRSAGSVRRELFLAELGRQALSGQGMTELFDCSCRQVSELLDADFVKILQLEPDHHMLRMIAGTGWRDGLVGHACVENHRASQAGYTLATDSAVVVRDLRAETRFSAPTLLHEHHVISGMSAPIHTRDRPFGVIGVHTRREHSYANEDTHFLIAVANVLGAALTSIEARHEQQRSASLFRALFEGSSDLIMLVASDGALRAVNPAGSRALGYPPEKLAGANAFSFVHPDDRAKAIAALESAVSTDEIVEIDLRVATSTGDWRIIEAVGRRVDLQGSPKTVVVNARDVTDRRALAEKVRRSERLETVGSVAATVAHDLSNVLQVIVASASLLHESLEDPSLREESNQILATSAMASKFLRGLLALTRVSEINKVPVVLNTLIEEMMPLLRRLLGSRAQLEFVPTTQCTKVHADPIELEQIVMNLVINARDATPHGGPIALTTSRTHQEGSPPHVVLSVTDRGVGMTDEIRARLFEPMFTTKARGHGTGLGMTIVHSLVRRAGASIAVSSEPGVGSTFEVTFVVTPS